MSSTEVTILSRNPFDIREKDNKTKKMVRIVFQTPDGRIGSTEIEAKEVNTEAEDKKLAEAIKKLPESAVERKEIKLD